MAFEAGPGLIVRIHLAMIKKGYSRAEFARSTGVSSNYVWSWFNGERLPNDRALHAIAEALGVSIEWLLTGRVEGHRVNGGKGDRLGLKDNEGDARI